MTTKRTLQIILGISLFGVAISGYLSYQQLFGAAVASRPAPGAPGTVLGYPPCFYQFFAYLVLAALAAARLDARRRRSRPG